MSASNHTARSPGFRDLGVVSLILLSPIIVQAQQTGALSDSGLAAASVTNTSRPAEIALIQHTLAANRALVVDPSVESGIRSSEWTVVLSREQGGSEASEAKIQINLCDWLPSCKPFAADLTLAGPIDKNETFTELADLDGLRGTARAELGGSYGNQNPSGFTAGARAVYSRPEFDYRTATTLSEQTERHDGEAFSASAGWKTTFSYHKSTVGVAALGQYRYEDTFKAASSLDVCQPASFGTAGTLTCDKFVVGPPSRSTKNVGAVEFKSGISGGAGIDVTTSWAKSTTGIDCRLYIIPDGKGGVGGGVRAGHRNDVPGWTFSIFAGLLKL